jgi:hypothetical protein
VLEKEGAKENGILSENLDVFRDCFEDGEELVEFPPGMQVLGNKGQFFDIAYNYIAYPEAVGDGGSNGEEKKIGQGKEGGFMKMFGF